MTTRHLPALHLAAPVTALLLLASLAPDLRAFDTPASGTAKPRATTPQFRIPEHVIGQARKLAAAEPPKTVNLKSRRPPGLDDLSSPAAIERAIAIAMHRLADPQDRSPAITQLI